MLASKEHDLSILHNGAAERRQWDMQPIHQEGIKSNKRSDFMRHLVSITILPGKATRLKSIIQLINVITNPMDLFPYNVSPTNIHQDLAIWFYSNFLELKAIGKI